MRDIAITLVVFAGLLYTLKKPYVGILLWSWISYMNPHRLAYGFAFSFPFALMVGLELLAVTLVTKQKQKIPFDGLILVWIIFIIFMGITTALAYYPDDAANFFKKVVKIQLVTFITMMLITDMDKLRKLIWVIVLSIGYYSVKGGIFTIKTGGGGRVWGPPGGFIQDNNGLAIATLMVIPLMIYLYQTTVNSKVKKGLMFAIILSLFSALGSQSRGALLTIVAVGGFYWLKSQRKFLSGILIVISVISLSAFMPESWYSRMNTIETYDKDHSAMGRINAWEFAFNAANDNILGLGFDGFRASTFLIYAPDPNHVQGAHSIYFYILGDHGWIGLIMFLIIFFGAWVKASKVERYTRNVEHLREYYLLSSMLKISFIAYFVGGAFLNLSYFDLPWHLVSFVVLMSYFLERDHLSKEKHEY